MNSKPSKNAANSNVTFCSFQREEKETGVHAHGPACNRKNCNVGRHSKKSKSVFPKINFLDLSKIHRKKNMKMCMQTTLAAEAGSSSEDYLPLLITSTDDLVLPINAEDSAHQPKKRKLKWNKSKEAFTKFLDTLTRTFCLPLLG